MSRPAEKNIEETMAEIAADLQDFEQWQDRYRYIIDQGHELPPYPERYRNEEHKVSGCVSQVWLRATEKDNRVYFEADSDAAITKGLIALLVRVYSGRTPREIVDHPPRFLTETGITSHLSPNRANGLTSIVRQMMAYGVAFGASHHLVHH